MGEITGSREAAWTAQSVSLDIRKTWVQSLVSRINSCVTSAELLHLSEPHFPQA